MVRREIPMTYFKRYVERKTVIIVRIVAIYQSLALLNSHLAPELNLTQLSRGSKKKRQITWPYLPILSTLGACKHSIHSYTTIYRSREKTESPGGVPLDSHDFTSHRKDGGSRGVTSVPLNSIVFCPLYHRFSLIIHPSHIIALFNHRSYTYIIPVFLRLLYRYHSSISTASL